MLQELIEFVVKPWVSLAIGTLIGICGIIISIILSRRSIVRNKLSYIKVEVEILSVANPSWETDLDIKYKGVDVKRLTASRVGIWNSGNTTINYDQVIDTAPLVIKVPSDAKILVCHATQVSRSVINVRVDAPENNQAKVLFDFLDPGDGFTLHVAQSSPQNTLQVDGIVKGFPQGLTEFSAKVGMWSAISQTALLPVLVFVPGVRLTDIIARSVSNYYSLPSGSWQYKTIYSTLIVIVLVFALISVSLDKFVQKRRSGSIPKAIRTDPLIATTMGLKSK